MFKSVFSKLFSVLLGIILICFLALAIVQTAFSARYWINDKEKLLTENAKTMAETISENVRPMGDAEDRYVLETDRTSTVPAVLDALAKSLDADVIITDNRGVVQFSSPTAEIRPGGSISSDYLSKIDASNQYFSFSDLGGLYESNTYVAGVPYTRNGTVVGYVFIAAPAKLLFDYLLGNLSIYIISLAAAMALCSLIAFGFTKRATKPIRDMIEASKKFGEGDFTARIEVEGNDELAYLASSLNNMATSLSEVDSVSRDFIGNISHELRTPMTTISGFVDGVLDGTIPPEKQEYYLSIVSKEVHRLSRLVTAMLNMSRIDKQTLKLQPKEFDLTELVGQTLLSFETRIEEKHLTIHALEDSDACRLQADEDLIGQVIYNLIDNAIKFTPKEGTITVSVKKQDTQNIFTIRNTGEGISSQEMRRIFDRFYKSDHSRSLDTTGAGLGLFIVKSVINMHHGEITVRSVEKEYTEFTFWLPNSQ